MSLIERAGGIVTRPIRALYSELENLYYSRVLGIKKEYQKLHPLAAALLIWKSERYFNKYNCIIEGYPFPSEGPAIMSGNHYKDGDSYKGVVASRRAGRLGTRTIVKAGLIDKNAQESAEFLASIGDKDDEFNKYSPIRAWVLRNVGVIPILRDNPGIGWIRESSKVLKEDQIAGVFLEQTRHDDCTLEGLQPGAAFIARKFPDVPVYPIAFSGPPDGVDKITILKPFTYNQKAKEMGRQPSDAEMTIIIADAIASGLPQRCQKDWETKREQELLRLNSLKNKTS